MDDKTRFNIMKTAMKLTEEGHRSDKVLKTIPELYGQWKDAAWIAEKGIEMYDSLTHAIDRAGGACWSVDDLCKMTVMKLISHLATNDVRFFFDKKE